MARDRSYDIAVTGLAARFPGASTIQEWWSALLAGRVLTTRYERHALLEAGVPESLLDDPDYVPVCGHLKGADRFDNTLFGVSPRDTEVMDPQHRLMLETAWAALEDAATGPLREGPVTGVFASSSGSGYLRRMVASGALDPMTLEQARHGTEPDFIAGLIAYKLDLTGPALAVQTACSSSLVGVHLAVQALLSGDCDQAVVVAAGVEFPQAGHLYVPSGIHSASGRCRPFDAHADGVVAGSGVTAIVLRRLDDALRDGPEAYGVILGTAINNDGATRAGYYAPSAAGQEAVIEAALRAAEIEATTVGYLETHGTGTRVGDPIEWAAASAALRGLGASPGQVAVGALKANTGHLDAAAGLASLIKALLVVKEGMVPPLAGFTRMNPLLSEESPLFVPTEAIPWTGPRPRRAGVSSFGIGGTNAHLIIEQAPEPALLPRHEREGGQLILLSAADPHALSRSVARLGDHLASQPVALADVSYTLEAGRPALSHRLSVVGRSSAEVSDRLADGVGTARGCQSAGGPQPVVFLFPGQGAQRPDMAVPFVRALPGFSSALQRCLEAFAPPLAARLRPALLEAGVDEAELRATELAQPALFAVEYAAATALAALGVTPAAVLGHSLGEITAACVAGAMDLPAATRFVVARGRAMQGCAAGSMLAVGCSEARARDLVAASGRPLELAAVNGPESCVVAGPTAEVLAFQSELGDGIWARPLTANRAFHSALIEPALPQLASELSLIDLRPLMLPLAANLTGRMLTAGEVLGPTMLVEQARRPVRFGDAIAAIAERFPNALLVEVGPGRTLAALAEPVGLTAVPLSSSRGGDASDGVLAALGALWTMSQPIETGALCGGGRRIHLPSYPFAGPAWMAPEAMSPAARPIPPSAERTYGDDGPAGAGQPSPSGCPTRDMAALLGNLWEELLGHADLDAGSDFFELGGDSLLMIHLARRINQEVGIQVPLRAMLAGRTLGRQTAIVLDLAAPGATSNGGTSIAGTSTR